MIMDHDRICSTHRETNEYEILIGKPEKKRPLGRPTRRSDNFKMDLQETGTEDLNYIQLAQDTVADSSIHGK